MSQHYTATPTLAVLTARTSSAASQSNALATPREARMSSTSIRSLCGRRRVLSCTTVLSRARVVFDSIRQKT